MLPHLHVNRVGMNPKSLGNSRCRDISAWMEGRSEVLRVNDFLGTSLSTSVLNCQWVWIDHDRLLTIYALLMFSWIIVGSCTYIPCAMS